MKNRLGPVVLCLYFFACGDTHPATDHPSNTQQIIDSAQHIFDAGQEERALHYIDSMYTAFPSPGPGDLFRKYQFKKSCFYKIAVYHEHKKYYFPQALAYADSMLQAVQENNPRGQYGRQYAEANYTKGDILLHMGRYAEAYQHYYIGKMAAEKNLRDCEGSDFTNRFGSMCYQQGKYLEAAGSFKDAFAALSRCDMNFESFAALQALLDNTGLSYYNAGLQDSAMRYYNAALAFIVKHEGLYPDKKGFSAGAKGVIYGNQASVYYRLGDTAAAEGLMKQSIAINLHSEEKMDAQVTQLKLAQLYLASNRLSEAGSLLSLAGGSFDTLPNTRARLTWYRLQAGYLAAEGQPAQANGFYQKYMALKDSLDTRDRELYSADAGLEMERLQKQYELVAVKKENELRALYLVLSIGFSCMAVLIFLLLWRSWRASKAYITRLTGLNAQLQEALARLEHSERENCRMTKIIAHDLKSPVATIASFAAWMMEHKEGSDRILPSIHKTATHALALIGDLLSLRVLGSELRKEPVDLYKLLQYCTELLQHKAAEKGVQVILRPAAATVTGDPEKLWRVFSNLIDNAIKFSQPESSVIINIQPLNQAVVTSVQDQGIGIPAGLKATLFSALAGTGREGTAGEPSFGLGLFIVQEIVKAHGGHAWVDSEEGNGACFYVSLPLESQKHLL